MANIITVPPSPQPWDILSGVISQFTDRYAKHRQEQEAMDLQRQQLAQTGQYQNRMAGVSEGQLKVQQEAQRLAADQQAYAQAKERWGAAYDQAIAPALASGRPEDFATGLTNIKALVQQYPEFAAFAGATALRLQSGQLPADAANAQANQYDLTQATRANTSTDPNAANYVTRRNFKADMPAYAFAQQQATDLQARGGGSTSPIPRPTGNAVTDYERRATEAMPTAGQNLGAQTQITTTGMQEAGATKRAGIAAAAGRSSQAQSEGQVIAQEIIAGRQPPIIQSRTLEGPVRAALAAGKYDLTRAKQDWDATQKYLSTLNGSGQVRLRQAVDFAYESLPVVKSLAEQWQGGRFPILNAVNLAAARQGAFGKDAQAIATKLDSQIVEMQAELAVVYRGGNSPTDEAMKQASKVLQANWSLPTLLANVELLETNLRLRRNSIVSAGVATNPSNKYSPNVTIAPPAGAGKPSATTDPLGLFH